MSGNGPLTEKFGAVTISIEARDVVRAIARQALDQDEPAFISAAQTCRQQPRIGELWKAEGGIYCGRLIDDDDRVYALVIAPRAEGEFVNVSWDQAKLKAGSLDLHGRTDWILPNRMEALAMWQRLNPALKDSGEAFAEAAYWTSEQHAVYSDFAWYQSFDNGYQYGNRKDGNSRARAVRRVVIK